MSYAVCILSFASHVSKLAVVYISAVGHVTLTRFASSVYAISILYTILNCFKKLQLERLSVCILNITIWFREFYYWSTAFPSLFWKVEIICLNSVKLTKPSRKSWLEINIGKYSSTTRCCTILVSRSLSKYHQS